MKFIPQNIDELLTERIDFCQQFINATSGKTDMNVIQSEFEKYLVDLKYCRSLKELYGQESDDYVKNKFKKTASEIVLKIVQTNMDDNCEKVIIYGITFFRYQSQSWLPKEDQHYFNDLSQALERIFSQIQTM